MCRMASFVVTRTAVLWSRDGDSHTQIRRGHGLPEATPYRPPDDVAVEIVPPHGDYRLPVDRWQFRVDQDAVPDWFDPREAEAAVRAVLPDWYAAHVLDDPDGVLDEVREGQTRIVLAGTVRRVVGGEVLAYDQSTVQTVVGGQVRAYDQSTVEAVIGGDVWAHGQSTVQAVVDGQVRADDQSTVQTVAGGTVWVYDQSTVKAVSGGKVWAHDQSTVRTVAGGTVWADGNAKVINDRRSRA